MKPIPLPDLDRDIYDLLAACAAAGIPVGFCGDDVTAKWELLAALRKLLRQSGVGSSTAQSQRRRFTVTPDHA
ncbi:MAG: hypothetical protein Q7V16_02750 [Hydrogenophaga sp.]|nr:hypothetical protein [Hydrogenophaga sp.]